MSVPELPPEVERIRYNEIDLSSEVGLIKGEEENPKVSIADDCLFVAVGKEVRKNKLTLIWALRNSGGRNIWILHVHTPAQMMPILGGKFPANQVGKKEVMKYREKERNQMLKSVDEYIQLCAESGVNAQKLIIEADSIESGIITLISQNMIGRLVMGAAANYRYKSNMTQLKSKKAIYVQSEAPRFCHIWFVCKGHLICTRERVKPLYPGFGEHEGDIDEFSTPRVSNGSSEYEQLSRTSVSDSSRPSTSSDVFRGSTSSHVSDIPQSRSALVLKSSPLGEEFLERSVGDELYDKLEKLMQEADSLRKEAYLESMKCRKAEKEAFEATQKAQATKRLYNDEKKQRMEIEEKLVKETTTLETTQNLHAKALEELGSVLSEKSSLEQGMEKSNLLVNELDEKISSTVDLLEKCKEERDQLSVELDLALHHIEILTRQLSQSESTLTEKELDEKISSAVDLLEKYKEERDKLSAELDLTLHHNEILTRQLAQSESTAPQFVSIFFANFTYLEILEATDNFNPSRKIGEGGFGDTYKGLLRHTEVAIKLLSSDNMQGRQEFQQEVDTLSKLRHPNIITLIGVCNEVSALIYEYLPNGNLDDRLSCKNNTPPLPWQTRIRVAAELCSVLIFLHSCKPESIIHGDLKPANILLDAKLSCKLIGFGINRSIQNGQTSTGSSTRLNRTGVEGTFPYMDPEFLSSGTLTRKSDVYSFGIILLRLLTGKPELGIVKEVQNALDEDKLNEVLDSSAGEWPFVQANQLAILGLRCCEIQRKNRPELAADVWRVLAPMRVSCRSFSSAKLGREEHDYVPPYFICPIFQEVMQDPHIAADGFTYEAEALRGWLDSGHDTSPMTNLKLENLILIPNRALRSAIQECVRNPPSTC